MSCRVSIGRFPSQGSYTLFGDRLGVEVSSFRSVAHRPKTTSFGPLG